MPVAAHIPGMLLTVAKGLVILLLAVTAFAAASLTLYATHYDLAPVPSVPSSNEIRAIVR